MPRADHLSTTHIAATIVTIQGRTIQRCAVCGEKLVDSRDVSMPLNADGSLPQIGTWEIGRMVRVSPGSAVLLRDDQMLPDDNCLALVE